MTPARWNEAMHADDDRAALTKAEMRAGWHFCPDFDGLLCRIGAQPVLRSCTCGAWAEAEIAEGA